MAAKIFLRELSSKRFKGICLIVIIICFFFGARDSVIGQPAVNQAAIDSINIYADTADDFLAIDFPEIRARAEAAYRNGDYENAARHYLYLLRYNVDDPILLYNLACCYGLLGRAVPAANFLARAMEAGFNDPGYIRNDRDFNEVRGDREFSTIFDSLMNYYGSIPAADREVLFDGASINRCLVRLPENYDPAKPYTLVLGLHGYGDAADHFVTVWDRFEAPDFIFAVPFAPYPFLTGDRLGYSWNFRIAGRGQFPGRYFDLTEKYIIDSIDGLRSSYNIREVYLMGHSQGASVAYLTGITHPDLFAGLICFSGPLNSFWLDSLTIKNAHDLRVFIAHGESDPVIRFLEGQGAKNLLEKYGYDVEFQSFAGGHEYPPAGIFKRVGKWLKR